MPVELHPKESLINAALMTKRPVAFLVGSPLSLKDGIGVPGIITMVDLVRAEIRDRIPFALPQFESILIEKSGAGAYQAAMKWLGVNGGQDAVNEVVAKAVLQARKHFTAKSPTDGDGLAEEWNIPPGTTALADLATRGGDRFPGPILTTNFDPLISLAIRQSGGQAARQVLAADGTLARLAENDPGICNVVHLHGFWRNSDTLHTQAQLTNPRPRLKASLQRLLVFQRRTLIVAAYGGWDDVFTKALVELMNDEEAQLDVIWCFHESDPNEVEQRYGNLLHAMQSAIVLNRFRLFGGIDCHSIFSDILSNLRRTSSPYIVAPSVSSPLAGWEQIDSAYLNSLPALSPDEIVRYFDGAVPTWRHAISAAIPRRQLVAKVTADLVKGLRDQNVCSMHLFRAAGAEGKSTLLLQVAADIASAVGWSVLWRPSPRERISPDQVANLDPTSRWLIVIDDADNIVRSLAESAYHLSQSGRTGVHFLLAARDTDWINARGLQEPWAEWLTHFPDIILRGINREDAEVVVAAWEQMGTDGLRALSSITDTAERIAVFESAVKDALAEQQRGGKSQDGSFFGGLLAVRFGQEGLQAHARTFLQRLQNVRIEHSTSSLFDALLYVAACHGIGIPGLDERVLADLVGVPREWVRRKVIRPLGEEAVAVYGAGHVLTRHSRVAAAILVEAEQTLGIDLTEVWTQLILRIVWAKQHIQAGEWYSEYSDIIHAGPRLQRSLPQQLSEERRRAIAIAAAKASILAEPERMSRITDLGRTYRNAGMIEQAVATFRDNLDAADSKIDFESNIRGYWYEWGVCEGLTESNVEHRVAGAWLQGLSISDCLNPARITPHQGKISCAGLGIAFGKLVTSTPDSPYALARRAITFLGRRFGFDAKAAYFNHYDRDADKLKTPHPSDIAEAIKWLTNGVIQAGLELKDRFLKTLFELDQVSFYRLQMAIDTDFVPPADKAHSSKTTKQSNANLSAGKLTQLSNLHEGRIQAGIERVLDEAWIAIPFDTALDKRIQLAIKNAKQTISRLSPHIRRDVSAHFQSKNWEPLKSREPKV